MARRLTNSSMVSICRSQRTGINGSHEWQCRYCFRRLDLKIYRFLVQQGTAMN